ncbi:MAG: 4Fe-4S dicluster domain-containing protein, partial [Anaeroplasmataceae bacterium]|nr:4Fe-4S dicluster domain-containing protein [Anaeroplasmataceae bacterium]
MILAKESIACTGCRYCVDDCPKKIAIPEYFKIFNNMNKFGETYKSRAKQNYEYQISLEHGRANDCIKCKKCEGHCPQ